MTTAQAVQTAVQVSNISKSYGTFRAVSDLSFEVHRGEIFAILGPNGAGKSTTIRMMLDILKPDSGQIAILGGPLTETTKNRVGYLPEERGLYRSVSVLEMMVYLGTLKGMTTPAARTRALAYLDQLGLAEFAKKKVSELSKGMQQKVQFAVTVLHDPDLIIIDEPFSGLDPVNTLVIKDMLTSLKQRGGAVIMSTHQMYQVEEMADRLLMIEKGRLALYGTVNEVRSQYAQNAIIVEGDGDWMTLDGVERMASNENGRPSATLFLREGTTPDQVLAQIAAHPAMRIQRFELAVPSLNDIFIRVVTGGQAADRFGGEG